MRPLRGRTEVGGETAGRVCSLHSPARPTAISFDRSAVADSGGMPVGRHFSYRDTISRLIDERRGAF